MSAKDMEQIKRDFESPAPTVRYRNNLRPEQVQALLARVEELEKWNAQLLAVVKAAVELDGAIRREGHQCMLSEYPGLRVALAALGAQTALEEER